LSNKNFIVRNGLTVGSFALVNEQGNINANTITFADGSTSNTGVSSITLTNDNATNATYYPLLSTSTSGTISVANTSSLGLNYVPSTGTLSVTILSSTSDANLKENINTIDNALDIINGIDGVRFNWKDNKLPSAGLVAQQVAQFMPELITSDNKNNLSLNYNGIIGVLVEAIKAQQKQIDELNRKVQ